MAKIFFISDTHFFHKNIIKNGGRPFQTVQEMNDCMVRLWNETVRPDDTVYHLGDVSLWKPETLEICAQLYGKKFLIRGNHDNYHTNVYTKVGFADIVGLQEFNDGMGGTMVLSHVPLHPCDMAPEGRWSFNVHGHIHQKQVQWSILKEETLPSSCEPGASLYHWVKVVEPDPRYLCVSVEQPWMNYRPISLDAVRQLLRERTNG